ncbi:MAG: glycosyltransferase [Flavobacteriaceae bacterium]|nr:glycosyltransferase [Flavobacteriaceae bacterium]
MELSLSIVVPVYNRPEEIGELLDSLCHQTVKTFEVVIVEDGSNEKAEAVVEAFRNQLNILYLTKPNTGPGDSRNYGMARARGNYFIILDSDCLLPPQYIEVVTENLKTKYTDFFGGPDTMHPDFSNIQKAINHSMTSFFTTGGIRNSESQRKFQPRSFNMGISKEAFEASGGFGNIHPGEDPDLTLRLWKMGFSSQLISEAFVYHKRRISWSKFYKQVYKFGVARPILDSWHPEFKSVTYWFPSLFLIAEMASIFFLLAGFGFPAFLFLCYFGLVCLDAFVKRQTLRTALLSILAVQIQFFGYGWGFLKSFFKVQLLAQKPQVAFPDFFFKH